MRKFFVVLALVLCNLNSIVNAQTTAAFELHASSKTQHVEGYLSWGRWTIPDVGVIYFNDGEYTSREHFIGIGYDFVKTDTLTLGLGPYFDYVEEQAPDDKVRYYNYLWVVAWAEWNITPKLVFSAEGYPYIPLGDGAKGWWISHVKAEFACAPWLKCGIGYAGYQFGEEKWQHTPFITATISPWKSRYGELETRYQRLSGGRSQVQFLYVLNIK